MTDAIPPARPGRERLWKWFGMGRPAFLTLPRVMMHAMPDEWQDRAAKLLEEYDAAFPNPPDLGTVVMVTGPDGKIIKTPDWIVNYRSPFYPTINEMRRIPDA